MGVKAKAAGVLVVVSGLLITGLAMAGSGKKKKRPPKETEPDDLEEDEVIVTTPTDNGEEADVVIDTKEIDDSEEVDESDDSFDEVLPDVVSDVIDETENTGGNKVDDKLADIAKEEGVREKEAVKEVVSEITEGDDMTALGAEETSKEMDPDGTVGLARIMLGREELPGWKSDLQPDVKEWQSTVGLTADGKFGPKSLGRMAMEVGILPLVRYYPRSVTTKKQGITLAKSEVEKAINALQSDLPDSQAQIDALTLSMGREKAQSMGTNNPPPQPTREFVDSVNDAIAEAAEVETEKELASA